MPLATTFLLPILAIVASAAVAVFLVVVVDASEFIYPGVFAQRLLLQPSFNDQENASNHLTPSSSHPQLTIIFTGDPQYHFPCTEANVQCKERFRDCTSAQQQQHKKGSSSSITWRQASPSPSSLSSLLAAHEQQQQKQQHLLANLHRRYLGRDCLHVESEFANEVQRKCIFHLIRLLEQRGQRPAALVINGDLTNFGHHFQLELFKADWLRTMPIPVLVGLGNHDYENNVGDCVANNCAQRMLRWFSNEYARTMSQKAGHLLNNLDLRRQQGDLWRTNFYGSLAYASRMCANADGDGKPASVVPPPFCVHSLQLHNRPDYAASIEHATEHWHIRGSFNWLLGQLNRIASRDRNEPPAADDDTKMGLPATTKQRQIVLINLHNHNAKVAERLRSSMELWHNLHPNAHLDFIILFAHIHEYHSITIRCLNNRTVPYIYVGSVPNNRFTTIRFHREEHQQQETRAEIFLLQANANSTSRIVQLHDFRWTDC